MKRVLSIAAFVLFAAPGRALPAAAQSRLSFIRDSAGAVRALAALPSPELPPGIPPLFALDFDSTGTLAAVRPVFRQLPAAYTGPVMAILREHAIPRLPFRRQTYTHLRVVTGPGAEISPRPSGRIRPELLNQGEITALLASRAEEILTPRERDAGLRARVRFSVNESGTADPGTVTIVASSGKPRADSAVAAAARAMRFRPATVEGIAVSDRVDTPLTLAGAGGDSTGRGAAMAPATLDGLSFPVAAPYQPVPALGDAHLAVFADARTRTSLFVATVPPGMHRTEAMARARANAANAALWAAPWPIRWIAVRSYPISRQEVYHDRRTAYHPDSPIVVQLRCLRIGGRDVITGYAYPVSLEEGEGEMFRSVRTSNPLAGRASRLIVAALAGEAPVNDDSVAQPLKALPPPEAAPHPEETAIRAAWAAIGAPALDGEAGPALAARPYLEYLDDMRYLALHAPAAVLRAEPMINQVYVLRFRHRVPPARLREMDARQLLGALWGERSTGLDIPRSRRDASTIERVTVVGELAFVWQRGSPTPDVFRREEGAWKEDFLPAVFAWEEVHRMSVQGDMSGEDEALVGLIGRMTRSTATNALWNPPASP
ncbi:MAG TPA: TonB family protein [Longimicrobium sp.]|nr:TonB family protein [Longimicrobium sp.]